MKKILVSLAIIFSLSFLTFSAEVVIDKSPNLVNTEEEVIKKVDNCTFAMTNLSDEKIGSCISIIRNNMIFFLTDAHCICDGLKYKIVKLQYDDEGKEDFSVKTTAEVWFVNKKLDFAVLRCNKCPGGNIGSTKFLTSNKIPKVGTKVFNVGHFLALNGQVGAVSYSPGIISQINRKTGYNGGIMTLDMYLFLQCTPGCSGSGVYNEKGECLGLICAGFNYNAVLINPVRQIKKWMDEAKIGWLLDDSLPVPTEAEVNAIDFSAGKLPFGLDWDDFFKIIMSKVK